MARGLMSQIEAQAPSSKLKQGHGVGGKGNVLWRGTRRHARMRRHLHRTSASSKATVGKGGRRGRGGQPGVVDGK